MLEGCTPYPAEFRDRYIREGYWRGETISQAVAAAVLAHRDRVAVIDAHRELTFAQLQDEAARIRAILETNGIERGDRIIVQLPNCCDFATFSLASFDLGAIPVMALPALRQAELKYLTDLANAKGIGIAPEYRGFDHAALACELRNESPTLRAIFTTSPARHCINLSARSLPPLILGEGKGGVQRATDPLQSGTSADPLDVALFLLSGGTTGPPKLIPRTHADYLYNAREAAKVCSLDETSRILIALPAEHNFPLACPGLIGALLVGATTVFTQTTKPEDLAAIIAHQKITHLPCVPTLAMSLLNLPEPDRHHLSSLRVITVGGQRLQEPTARAVERALPRVTIQQVFGMAEGLLCYTRLDDPDDIACTTQGRPLSPADEIRIVDGSDREVAPGELGELCCRGPYTVRSYYRAEDKNAEAFTPDGFFRTGDLVRLTSSGNLVVEGRIKDQINRGGEKIGAEEVEAHLLAHPAIASAAVVAMPDRMLGERACAYVTLRAGHHLILDEVKEFLAARGLAKYKWPERLEILNAMPLTNVGKIKKAELRRDIETRITAEQDSHAAQPRESTRI